MRGGVAALHGCQVAGGVYPAVAPLRRACPAQQGTDNQPSFAQAQRCAEKIIAE